MLLRPRDSVQGLEDKKNLILHTGQSDPKISLSEIVELAITSSERGLEFLLSRADVSRVAPLEALQMGREAFP
jgi:hypothetical protein